MSPSETGDRPPEVAIKDRPEANSAPQGEVNAAPETAPVSEAQQSGGPQPQVVANPINAQLPTLVPTPNDTQQTVVADDTPLMAADDEVIEQEWVQKAKKIVLDTKSDPYSQEKEVGKLQAEYIKKRYGKEIKLTSN